MATAQELHISSAEREWSSSLVMALWNIVYLTAHCRIANTLDAHRVIQHFQEEKGPETADKLINCTA